LKRTIAFGAGALAVGGAAAVLAQNLGAYNPSAPFSPTVRTDLGSLAATRSINESKVIPAPEPTYGGVINKTAFDSTAWWAPKIVPKPGSPNVLLVLIDDEGFGASSAFGGPIPTPALDQLAKEGLRYNNFHTTSLCSPTRAALITGRNHDSVGFGMIAEVASGFPGYDAIIPKSKQTVARILQANGYATAWFGKNHNVPLWQASGPYENWPTGQGFDYFYGFIGGDMDQWHPTIYENTTPLFPDAGHPGYNLNVDLADKAIRWLNHVNDTHPEQPVLLYYAPGATHAPHQPTPEWIAKFKGKFNSGWSAMREYTFKRQLEKGIIPKAAKLTPFADKAHEADYLGLSFPDWDSLTPQAKALYEHEMEVYAAYLAQTDYEIGRVVQAFKDTHRYKNTLTIYISGDNGASAEGNVNGTYSEVAAFNGFYPTVEELQRFIPIWGSAETDPHFSSAWAWALDTPFKWTKQVASYFGGTKNGMTVVWPGHIADPGSVRQQFSHVIDVVPTILEACGITQPEEVDGVKQEPIEGTSFAYTFDKANASAPSQHHQQYFEMFGARAEYEDGWIAATDPFSVPWLILSNKFVKDPWNDAKWHLYHVTPDADWTEYTDVKAQYPDKLKHLQDLFLSDAQKYNVLPLNNLPTFFNARPSAIGNRSTVVYHPGIFALNQADTPNVLNNDYSIEGDVTVGASASGAIVANGGRFGGYSLWLKDGVPVYSYNLLEVQTSRWAGKAPLSPGHHLVKFNFVYDGGGPGKGGVGTLSVDGKPVDSHRIAHTTPGTLPWFEGLDIGADNSTPVDAQYKVPNTFTGEIKSVTFHSGPMKLTEAELRQYQALRYNAAKGIQ
jgi:arylsulfatase